jgi:CrcB protein
VNLLWLVAAGGAVGSVLRYLMASSIQKMTPANFPLGTVMVNIVGCFVIGLLYVWLIDRTGPRPELRALLMVGVMGGFTTFSSFSLETVTLVMQGSYANAVANVLISVFVCLLGTTLGIMLGRNI